MKSVMGKRGQTEELLEENNGRSQQQLSTLTI